MRLFCQKSMLLIRLHSNARFAIISGATCKLYLEYSVLDKDMPIYSRITNPRNKDLQVTNVVLYDKLTGSFVVIPKNKGYTKST